MMEYVTLNNGVKMPKLGYGVYQVSSEDCERGGGGLRHPEVRRAER